MDGECRPIQSQEEHLWIGLPMGAHQPLPLSSIATELGDQINTDRYDARATFAVSDQQAAAVEIDIGHAQPHCFSQPQPSAIQHQDQRAQHWRPNEAPPVGSGGSQEPANFLVAEDVGQEDRFLDRRQGVLRHIARWITATAV